MTLHQVVGASQAQAPDPHGNTQLEKRVLDVLQAQPASLAKGTCLPLFPPQ